MTMEWKKIDDKAKDGGFQIVGKGTYFTKAHYSKYKNSWRDKNGNPLSFEPTHCCKIESTPKVIDLKIGDYVRRVQDGIVVKMWNKGFVALYIEAIEKGIFELVEVIPKRDTE